MSKRIIDIPKEEIVPVFENLWTGLIQVCDSNNKLAKFLDDTFSERNRIIFTSKKNFRRLVPRPFIYLVLDYDPDVDIEKLSVAQWVDWINTVFNFKKDDLSGLLKTKSVAVFHSTRYLPLVFLRNVLGFTTNRCVDFGCSLNFGFTWLTQIDRNNLGDIKNLTGTDFEFKPAQGRWNFYSN